MALHPKPKQQNNRPIPVIWSWGPWPFSGVGVTLNLQNPRRSTLKNLNPQVCWSKPTWKLPPLTTPHRRSVRKLFLAPRRRDVQGYYLGGWQGIAGLGFGDVGFSCRFEVADRTVPVRLQHHHLVSTSGCTPRDSSCCRHEPRLPKPWQPL